jgi:hypothetical protein
MDDVATNQLRGFIERTGSPAPGPTFLNPSNIPRSTVCYDNTPITGGFWLLAKVAGVSTWTPMGAPPALTGWSKYVVSNQATPLAPYTKMEDACAAAVGDGHDPSNPAVVQVMPGTYSPALGILTLPPGISLIATSTGGDTQFVSGDVIVNAGLLLLGTVPSSHTIAGFQFLPPPGTPALQVSGSAILSVAIKACHFASAVGPTLVLNNTANTLPDVTLITMVHGTVTCDDPALTVPAVLNTGVRGFATFQTLVQRTPIEAPAATIDGSGSFASIVFNYSVLFGKFVLGKNCRATLTNTTARTTVTMFDMTGGDANTNVLLDRSQVSGPAPLTSGPGFIASNLVQTNDPEFDVASRQKGSATLSYVAPVIVQAYSTVSAGPFPLNYPIGDDVLYVDTGGFDCVINLPTLDTMLDGVTLEIKSVNVAGDISVKPDAVDEIDGLGAGNSYLIMAPPLVGYASRKFRVSTAGTGRVGKWLSFP